MDTHRTESGVPLDRSTKRSHEIEGNNPLAQRVQLKFRQAVGRAMEEISDDDIRNGIKAIQQEVVDLLRKLQEESGLDDDSIQIFEDEIIIAKVNAFIAMTALDAERDLRKQIVVQNKALRATVNSNQEELRKEMYDDLTTNLYRKKYLLSSFRKTLSILQREAYNDPVPMSLIFFDIDHFKKVNDTYGHPTGDEVLKGVGEIVGERFQRESDTVGRYGGEEFVVILSKCNEHNAALLAEDLRKQIEETVFTTFVGGKKVEFNVTASIGVLTAVLHKFPNDDFEKVMKGMLKQADALMYEGKQNGRNRVSTKQINIGKMPDGDGAII